MAKAWVQWTLLRVQSLIKVPLRLQSMGSRRVGHDWAASLLLFTFMHWRRKWHPTPVFLPGESQGRGSLVGCRLWGRRVGHDWSDSAAAASGDLLVSADISYNLTLKGHLPALHIFKIHLFTFWLQLIACGILVPLPGIEPAPPASEAQNLNQWTTEKSLHIFNWHLGFYYKLNSGKGYNFHHTVTSENF